MSNTTILVNIKTRKLLQELGKKDQTYDEIIRELIKQKVGHSSKNLGGLET
jgi:hypothetical protein